MNVLAIQIRNQVLDDGTQVKDQTIQVEVAGVRKSKGETYVKLKPVELIEVEGGFVVALESFTVDGGEPIKGIISCTENENLDQEAIEISSIAPFQQFTVFKGRLEGQV